METTAPKNYRDFNENWLLASYEEEIHRYPLLSRDEELEIARKARLGDLEAMDKLVVSNLRFVVNIAKQYRNNGLSFEDLISEGNIGLMKAAERFDETKGFKFVTYAVWWIRQSILQALSETNRFIRLPLNRITDQSKVERIKTEFERQNGYEPRIDQISEALGLEEYKVSEAISCNYQITSINLPLEIEDDDEITLGDKIENMNAETPDHLLNKEDLRLTINSTISTLPPKEAKVLDFLYGEMQNNYGSESSDSLTNLAEEMSLTPERIRQLRREGLKKMQENGHLEALLDYI